MRSVDMVGFRCDAGQDLYRRACNISAQTAEAWDAVRRMDHTPRGRLDVSISEGIDAELFLDFVRDYPEVSVVVRRTSRYVDLVAEGVDVAIRYGAATEPDLFVRKLATIRTLVAGSPTPKVRAFVDRAVEHLPRWFEAFGRG